GAAQRRLRDRHRTRRGGPARAVAVAAQAAHGGDRRSGAPRGAGGLSYCFNSIRPFELAEQEGFEPSIRRTVYRISSPAHSTTLPPLLNSVRVVRSPR